MLYTVISCKNYIHKKSDKYFYHIFFLFREPLSWLTYAWTHAVMILTWYSRCCWILYHAAQSQENKTRNDHFHLAFCKGITKIINNKTKLEFPWHARARTDQFSFKSQSQKCFSRFMHDSSLLSTLSVCNITQYR